MTLQWRWIVSYQQKEKKEGSGRRSLYPKCQKHGEPMRKFSDGSDTVPLELKPKYKPRKPKAEVENPKQTPLSTSLSKCKVGGLQSPVPNRWNTNLDNALREAECQPEGSQATQPSVSQLPFCMQMRAEEETRTRPQPQPEGGRAPEPQRKDYFSDQLARSLTMLDTAGVKRDGNLWKRVEATYLSNPVGEIMKRGKSISWV